MKLLLFGLCGLAVGGLALAGLATPARSDSCAHTVVASVISPDQAWRATVDEAVCEGGAFATSVVATVQLGRADDAGPPIDLLGTDTGGHPSERPRLRWTGVDTLQVTVPNRSFLKVLARRVGPVSVDLRFDPPDPAGRAVWLRSMGLPPDGPDQK
jgi:hypothetical protein